ncbi:MAG: nucleotide exchange factor GrpE [Anaerolineae bacterium]
MAKRAASKEEKPVQPAESEAEDALDAADAEVQPAAEAEAQEPLPDDPEALKGLVEKERAKVEEYLDKWRRARADFANFRKRNDREREEMIQFANSVLVNQLLPILDDFERAGATLPGNLSHLTWVDGIFLIHRKLDLTLQAEGLKPIEAIGQAFDPMVHEAVAYEPSEDHDEGTVLAELQRGYTLHDRVIRPALVKVARGAAEPKEAEPVEADDGSEGSETAE